jgi:hypothetical protein
MNPTEDSVRACKRDGRPVHAGLRCLPTLMLLTASACSSTSAKTTPTDAGGTDGPSGVVDAAIPASGAATLDGTMNGQTFAPVNAVSFFDGFAVVVYLSSLPDACGIVQRQASSMFTPSLTDVTFAFDVGSPQSAVVVGTYSEVTDGNPTTSVVEIQTDVWSSTCAHTISEMGGSPSTATLTSVGASYIGSFDVTFTSGDHVTGAFNAPFCDVTIPDAGADGGVVTCGS